MIRRLSVWSLIVATLLIASAIAASIKVTSPIPLAEAQQAPLGANWEKVNYDGNGGGYNPQTQITKDNVQYLETKWLFPFVRPTTPQALLTGYGSMAPPIVVDGTVIVVLNDRRVLALNAATGKRIWQNDYGNTYNRTAIIAKYPWLSAPSSHVHAINYYADKGWVIPSVIACYAYAIDVKTGKTAWTMEPELMCGTNQEFGDTARLVPGTAGRGFMSAQAHPPVILGNTMFFPIGGGSGSGGTAFVAGYDISNPASIKRLYREFITPNPYNPDPEFDVNLCKAVNGNGWYFEYPKYLEAVGYPNRDRPATYLATNCRDADPEVLKYDWFDLVPTSRTYMKMHTADAVSPVWGNYPVDPETGIVYMGWGDQGPYGNLTNRYGPGTPGSGMTAHDIRTGKMIWYFVAAPHDLWDYDCAWNGILTKINGKAAFIKHCKDGKVYALDGATGKPLWIWDAPTLKRTVNYGVGRATVVDKNAPQGIKTVGDNTPNDPNACCRLTKKDMSKRWMIEPEPGPMIRICGEVCLESDIAFDGKKLYIGHFNWVDTKGIGPVRDFGNNDVGGGGAQIFRPLFPDSVFETNTNIDAVDVTTGKLVWTYRIEGATLRGGLMATGGMVVAYLNDGSLRFVETETGKLVHQKNFGIATNVMPTIGADSTGKMKIFLYLGGATQGFVGWPIATPADGSLVAYGLPDVLPQPQVITKEVIKEVPKEVVKEVIKEVPKEVIREVPKEVIKEVPKEVIKEVPKEVIKEVTKTVTVETISPISYAAIAIGVVLVVVSGVIMSRRKRA
ncbi:MAG TPA: PQQ-binding-like beta-propeller repeat protein [Nitrososphaerales archaeon]